MPVFRNLEQINSTIVGLWKIEESYKILMEKVKSHGFDISLLEKFKSKLKQKQWLAARLLLTEMDRDIKRIYYNNWGAPFLEVEKFISLSHSKDMVAVTLDNKADTGIDVQYYSPKIELIKNKFCSENELNFVRNSNSLRELHLIWSAKESIYKKLKIPGLSFKENIQVMPFIVNDKGRIESEISMQDKVLIIELQYEIVGDYSLVYTLNN